MSKFAFIPLNITNYQQRSNIKSSNVEVWNKEKGTLNKSFRTTLIETNNNMNSPTISPHSQKNVARHIQQMNTILGQRYAR